MVTRRTAKAKGAALEYDVEYNLRKRFPGIYLTKERGFQRQFDLCSDLEKIAIECKRLKGFSWNELKKYFTKLKEKAPKGYTCFLIFQANRQPALVMRETLGMLEVREFINYFGGTFEKHPSTRGQND